MKYRTRKHTECETMIKEIKELKERGEVMQNMFFCTTSYERNGVIKRLKPVVKNTAYGISKYANDMYIKYGDSVCVEVTYFDKDFNSKTYTTYSC